MKSYKQVQNKVQYEDPCIDELESEFSFDDFDDLEVTPASNKSCTSIRSLEKSVTD